MLVQVHAKRVAATLRQQIPGIRRVLVARTDGLPFYDELVDPTAVQTDDEAASAVVAAMLGLADHVSSTSQHGRLSSASIRSDDGCLTVYRAGDAHVLAVYAGPQVNLILLDRLATRLAGDLAGS